MDCDTLLMVGSSFPYSEFLPEEGKARGVQIDLDGRMLGIRYPMEVNLVGDSTRTLRALIGHSAPQGGPLLAREDRRRGRGLVGADGRARASSRADPINPQLVFWELSQRLPDDAILSSDSGSAANWFARDLKLRAGDDGLPLGHARDDGARRALRDRRQVRLPRRGPRSRSSATGRCR